jgi:hypothetical protein
VRHELYVVLPMPMQPARLRLSRTQRQARAERTAAGHVSLAERVQSAIQEHLDEQGGGFATEFLLVANYIDAGGEPSYFLTVPDDQRLLTSLGLARWGELSCEADARRHFADSDDDEL